MRRPLPLPSLLFLLAACAPAHSAGPVTPAATTPAPRADELFAAGRAARQVGDVALAQQDLEVAIEASPAWDLPRIELAELLIADGSDLARAQAAMQAVRTTENPRAELIRAQLAELTGDDEGAAEAYAHALVLRPDPDVRLRRISALLRLGRDGDAEAELLLARAERPADAGTLVALADLRERGGRLAEAEADLRAAAEVAPGRPAGWDRLARFYARTGQAAKAREAEAHARGVERPPDRKLRPLLPSGR